MESSRGPGIWSSIAHSGKRQRALGHGSCHLPDGEKGSANRGANSFAFCGLKNSARKSTKVTFPSYACHWMMSFRQFTKDTMAQKLLDVIMLVEMVFEMPEEISGQKNSTVLCQARIMRSKGARDTEAGHGLAAAILDYKFIHQS